MLEPHYELAIIGGGINGSAVARDAAGRGIKTILLEKDDLASGTSSASTKLIHGGLRYLEHYEFGMVRKALQERAVLLKTAPHIIWPMRFILPHNKHLRPYWLIRSGLFLYDHLATRGMLGASRGVDLRVNKDLQAQFTKGFEYADCWVQDSRLVVLNCMAAKERGADILTRAEVTEIKKQGKLWEVSYQQRNKVRTITANTIVNAAGPWASKLLDETSTLREHKPLRLVKGSHIVVKQLFPHQNAYIFQHTDSRVIFAIPYEQKYTLIGTTDIDVSKPEDAVCSDEEKRYLCDAVNHYFRQQISLSDIIWDFSGVRPLVDDEAEDAMQVSRDYQLQLLGSAETGRLLTIYGGKITTSRTLAESVLKTLYPASKAWTAEAALPGGDFAGFDSLCAELRRAYPWLPAHLLTRYARNYGTSTRTLISDAKNLKDMGKQVKESLYEREVEYLKQYEFARTMDDILWRRTKLGLHLLTAGK